MLVTEASNKLLADHPLAAQGYHALVEPIALDGSKPDGIVNDTVDPLEDRPEPAEENRLGAAALLATMQGGAAGTAATAARARRSGVDAARPTLVYMGSREIQSGEVHHWSFPAKQFRPSVEMTPHRLVDFQPGQRLRDTNADYGLWYAQLMEYPGPFRRSVGIASTAWVSYTGGGNRWHKQVQDAPLAKKSSSTRTKLVKVTSGAGQQGEEEWRNTALELTDDETDSDEDALRERPDGGADDPSSGTAAGLGPAGGVARRAGGDKVGAATGKGSPSDSVGDPDRRAEAGRAVIHEGGEVFGGPCELDNAVLGRLSAEEVRDMKSPTSARAEARRRAVVAEALSALERSGALTAEQLSEAGPYLRAIRGGRPPLGPLPTAGEMAALAFAMFADASLLSPEGLGE